MYRYKINKLYFNDGNVIEPGSLTVIVGPNNSGKSRILKDIKSITTEQNPRTLIIKDVDFTLPSTVKELTDAYKIQPVKDKNNNLYLRTLSANLSGQHNIPVPFGWEQSCQSWLETKNENTKKQFSSWFGNFFVALFETEERLKVIKETQSSDIRENVTNLLQAFYKEGIPAEKELRNYVRSAFNIDIRLDFSSLQKILFRVGENLDGAPTDPREALSYYENKEKLDAQGDGIRSFVATILVVQVGKRPVLLLDEPEAFLHPPQAYRLGELLAEWANDNRQIIVATHSVDFLRGVISKRQDVNLVRVDRIRNSNIINVLESKEVLKIATNPLLSSTRMLDALFYKGVIVVESDADSIFYQRIARQNEHADNIHFTHAHNKQTISKVLPPYRSLGVKFAAIVDFDILRVRDEFKLLIDSLNIESEIKRNILSLREELSISIEEADYNEILKNIINQLKKEISSIEQAMANSDPQTLILRLTRNLKKIRETGSAWADLKKRGINALDEEKKKLFRKISETCSQYGLFIVPCGELESWLTAHGLEYSSNKARWIVSALEKISEIKPDKNEDPWKFINQVIEYIIKGKSS
ncbi:MAG TPA: hypothetical protein ENI82_01065 [Bacteroidetes bacterium]|nr:hypothetical protein [Bacteroidota bacterium]